LNTDPPDIQIRPSRHNDLPAILSIQSACYTPEMNESEAIWRSRLEVAGEFIWVAEFVGEVCAYLASYPSQQGKIAPLGSAFAPCNEADCLYLHDLAVSPQAGGKGFGRKLVAHALTIARQRKLPHAGLVCVQNALGFWQSCGFIEQTGINNAGRAALATYEPQARYMAKPC